MANANALLIRYLGADHNRYHVIQLGSGEYWTGEEWSPVLDCAKVFRKHRDAQVECLSIQRQRYKGLPARTFKIEANVTLVAPDVEQITIEQLAEFIRNAVRIDVESSQFGDGPVEGSFVHLRPAVSTLEATVKRS